MKRVIVIGCPGSGKSRLSRALSERCGLPVYHLDLLYWNPDKTTVSSEVFRERLSAVLSLDEWIIDGNYSSTMEMRIAASDAVVFLDYPTEVCLEGARARIGKERPDMPWVELEEDAEFTEFIEKFRENERPRILALLEKYGGKRIFVLASRDEADAFVSLF